MDKPNPPLPIDSQVLAAAEKTVGHYITDLLKNTPHITTPEVIDSFLSVKIRQFQLHRTQGIPHAAALELIAIAAACTCCYARIIQDTMDNSETHDAEGFHGQ